MLAAAVYGRGLFGQRGSTADALGEQALTAPSVEQQEQAAAEMIALGAAVVAASRMLGRDYGLGPNMPAAERARLVALMRKEWDDLQGTELLEDMIHRMHQCTGKNNLPPR